MSDLAPVVPQRHLLGEIDAVVPDMTVGSDPAGCAEQFEYQRAGVDPLVEQGIATTLLGDPRTIILDEPVNGLGPEGVLWIRNLLKGLAEQGRTVLVSSHLMSEMAVTAEDLIVVGRGRLLSAGPIADFIARSSRRSVRVHAPEAARLREVLLGDGVTVSTAAGLSNDDIAQRLYLSPYTAKTHVNRIMTKLGVPDRSQLVVLAYRTGFTRP